jgi:hypothetical protein
VTAYDWMGSYALLPIGLVVVGVLAEHVGATEVMGVGGALAFVFVLLALLPRDSRALGQMESAAAPPPVHSGLTPGTSGDVVR